MIQTPVVFILGAGASMPYGYPSGTMLVRNTLSLHDDVKEILSAAGFDESNWSTFQDALRKSALSSIDAFLERRPDMRDLGQLLITSIILRCEHESGFYLNSEDDWYPMLVNMLDDPFESHDFRNATIVTFNYDRSLEQFLFQSLCNRHNKGCDEVAGALAGLRIIHVYGYLGPLNWQEPGGRQYSPELQLEDVMRASKGIKIISEGRDDSDEFMHARALIRDANRVFILGMGYHSDNMRRLGLPLENSTTSFSGSAFGTTHHERERFRSKYNLIHIGAPDDKCVGFLRNNPDFLGLQD